MKRRTLDAILVAGGVVLTVVLIVAGSLLMWGYTFASSNVRTQLSEQQIYFPSKAAFAHAKPGTEITPSMIPSVSKYAGQQLLNGAQAEAYANHFIAVHLSEMPYGGVYAKISTAARADPTNKKLQALTQTSFQGTTLRGLLLEAYGYWEFGQIALIASICAYALGLIMLILVILGLVHLRKVRPDEEVKI
ncbi:MAG: hypothetical protein M1134_02880 [Actinobacteria bacterium]|jgi:hypothetical protein|nr:hypothetical protein [Actinomycetota bacterium]